MPSAPAGVCSTSSLSDISTVSGLPFLAVGRLTESILEPAERNTGIIRCLYYQVVVVYRMRVNKSLVKVRHGRHIAKPAAAADRDCKVTVVQRSGSKRRRHGINGTGSDRRSRRKARGRFAAARVTVPTTSSERYLWQQLSRNVSFEEDLRFKLAGDIPDAGKIYP